MLVIMYNSHNNGMRALFLRKLVVIFRCINFESYMFPACMNLFTGTVSVSYSPLFITSQCLVPISLLEDDHTQISYGVGDLSMKTSPGKKAVSSTKKPTSDISYLGDLNQT